MHYHATTLLSGKSRLSNSRTDSTDDAHCRARPTTERTQPADVRVGNVYANLSERYTLQPDKLHMKVMVANNRLWTRRRAMGGVKVYIEGDEPESVYQSFEFDSHVGIRGQLGLLQFKNYLLAASKNDLGARIKHIKPASGSHDIDDQDDVTAAEQVGDEKDTTGPLEIRRSQYDWERLVIEEEWPPELFCCWGEDAWPNTVESKGQRSGFGRNPTLKPSFEAVRSVWRDPSPRIVRKVS